MSVRRSATADNSAKSLMELAYIFLKLGTTAFGGPAAHISMMRSAYVDLCFLGDAVGLTAKYIL